MSLKKKKKNRNDKKIERLGKNCSVGKKLAGQVERAECRPQHQHPDRRGVVSRPGPHCWGPGVDMDPGAC